MKDPQKSMFSFKQYADIGFFIMMQLFGHKVEYAESNITKDGVEENGRMWEKAAEELNESIIMEQKKQIADLKERIAKNGKISIQECKRTSYELIPRRCE